MSDNIAAALAQAAVSLEEASGVDETMQRIAEVARDSVPGFDHASITLKRDVGELFTQAATSDLVRRLDGIQYEHEEGPCVDAIRAFPVVAVPHLPHAQHWPQYVPAAAREGVRSQLAVQLRGPKDALGGLNLYSTENFEIDSEAVHVAELLAIHAAIALSNAQHQGQLQDAIESRTVIGQAVGMVMERYQLDAGRAFDYLVRASSHANVKLRVIAQEVVDQAGRDQT